MDTKTPDPYDGTLAPFSVTIAKGDYLATRSRTITPRPDQTFVTFGITPKPSEFLDPVFLDWLRDSVTPLIGPDAAESLRAILDQSDQRDTFMAKARAYLEAKDTKPRP